VVVWSEKMRFLLGIAKSPFQVCDGDYGVIRFSGFVCWCPFHGLGPFEPVASTVFQAQDSTLQADRIAALGIGNVKEMAVYLFQSKLDARVFGFTTDPLGAGLPPDLAPWGEEQGRIPAGVGLTAEVEDSLHKAGFFLSRQPIAISATPKAGAAFRFGGVTGR
jgi:hypothetical protein